MDENLYKSPTQGSCFRRFLHWSRQAMWFLAAIGLAAMSLGMLTIPLAGWGAAYVFAVGLWTFVAAGLPALVWLIGVAAFRTVHGEWYFGGMEKT